LILTVTPNSKSETGLET